jgi:hypothetical protein
MRNISDRTCKANQNTHFMSRNFTQYHTFYKIMWKDVVNSSWKAMAHGDAREGKWRGNWRMDWVASTLHTTSEHGVSSITTADAHTSAASVDWTDATRRFKWTRSDSPKDEIWFMRVCHHISTGLYSHTGHSWRYNAVQKRCGLPVGYVRQEYITTSLWDSVVKQECTFINYKIYSLTQLKPKKIIIDLC